MSNDNDDDDVCNAGGFHAFVLTTSHKKLLDGGRRGGVESFCSCNCRWAWYVDPGAWKTIEAARVADKAEQVQRWMVEVNHCVDLPCYCVRVWWGKITHTRSELQPAENSMLEESDSCIMSLDDDGVRAPLAKLRRLECREVNKHFWLKFSSDVVDDTPIFILSIDGGGVKGLIQRSYCMK